MLNKTTEEIKIKRKEIYKKIIEKTVDVLLAVASMTGLILLVLLLYKVGWDNLVRGM